MAIVLLLRSAVAGVLVAAALSAQAQNYSFDCLTGNRAADCAVGEAQLGLQVIDRGSSVDLRFTNSGSAASSITDIYFDWLSATYELAAGSITDSGAGVSFSWGASPSNLPGGNPIGFSANIAADSNTPTQPMGVNPGEWVNFNFAGSYANLLAGLNGEQLRIGVHVQGFYGGGSESFVVTPVPEPEIYAMLLAGMGLMGLLARRRRRLLAA
jgi:hypothetical protein